MSARMTFKGRLDVVETEKRPLRKVGFASGGLPGDPVFISCRTSDSSSSGTSEVRAPSRRTRRVCMLCLRPWFNDFVLDARDAGSLSDAA